MSDAPRPHAWPTASASSATRCPGWRPWPCRWSPGAARAGRTRRASGWAHLLEHMVFKGAGERSARDIVEAIEAAGGQINAATGHERTSFQVRALKGGLPLAHGGDRRPGPAARPSTPTTSSARRASSPRRSPRPPTRPTTRCSNWPRPRAFGGQPLGRPILGTVDSSAPATPATLEAWRAGLYAPDRLVVSAAGRGGRGRAAGPRRDGLSATPRAGPQPAGARRPTSPAAR